MSRPQHLNCVNTPEGICRINEEQARYDKDPGAYEDEQRAEAEYHAQLEAECQAQAEAEAEAAAQAEYEASQYQE